MKNNSTPRDDLPERLAQRRVLMALALRQRMIDEPGEAAEDAFTERMMQSDVHIQTWIELTEFDAAALRYLQRIGREPDIDATSDGC